MSLCFCENRAPPKEFHAKAQRNSKDAKRDSHSMKLPFIVDRRTRVIRRAMLAILLAPLISPAQTVETVQFQSKLVNATLPYNVILPPDYRTSSTTRYPVLYLLHGLTGHYSDWLTKTNVADYAAQYRMIVVMPEGKDGWYTDSATVPNDKYESYILKNSGTRKANDIFEIVRSMTANRIAGLPYFYLDCGTEDGLFSSNQQFAALLREKKVPHEYRELPGDHNWAYWDQQLQGVLKIAAQKLHRVPSKNRYE